MLELATGLTTDTLVELADLERRTVAVDGGRLKLEWPTLRSRSGTQVEDLLWREDGRLLGFLGLYGFGGPDVELAGMVDPAVRRRHIATELLGTALPLCRERDFDRALLVTPRQSKAGVAFARTNDAVLEHSEHALVMSAPPVAGPADPDIAVRPASDADTASVIELMTAAFGRAHHAPADPDQLIVERDGRVIGALRVNRDGDRTGVYGFAVAPALRGQGIGRDVLRRVCAAQFEAGVSSVGLEVAVDNDHALGLYTSLGFTPLTTEDYYAIPLR